MMAPRDFRPDALVLARLVNERATSEGKPRVVEIDSNEFVHLYCEDILFIVFKDVLTAGSHYFEGCVSGFCKESYVQKVKFEDGDIDPEALELYLSLTHSWFFEIRFRGVRVVPVQHFRMILDPIEEQPFSRADLEIPLMKLEAMAEVFILADYFLHRSLLNIVQQMFLSLIDVVHLSWLKLKDHDPGMCLTYHGAFVVDYANTFELLCTGHADEYLLRNALTESFYWITLKSTHLTTDFRHLMSDAFVAEWSKDRSKRGENDAISYAKGIFTTDQYCFESSTRIRKLRRFKRIVNMVSFESQRHVLPSVANPLDLKIRLSPLHATVRRIEAHRRAAHFNAFVPGAASHQLASGSSVNSNNGDAAGGGEAQPRRGDLGLSRVPRGDRTALNRMIQQAVDRDIQQNRGANLRQIMRGNIRQALGVNLQQNLGGNGQQILGSNLHQTIGSNIQQIVGGNNQQTHGGHTQATQQTHGGPTQQILGSRNQQTLSGHTQQASDSHNQQGLTHDAGDANNNRRGQDRKGKRAMNADQASQHNSGGPSTARPSNQATLLMQQFPVVVNTGQQPVNRASRMQSMINNIQSFVIDGGHNARQFLDRRQQLAGPSQPPGPSQQTQTGSPNVAHAAAFATALLAGGTNISNGGGSRGGNRAGGSGGRAGGSASANA
ncbi:Putative SKP1/BTB/POZ domain superfamily protein [Colletotrichum destructivum]|uniref:SKP1/BTB/POZ domain superfamily protein n=1 Tax=Colletotrichum destructivum TaxID=34406 RepID=A0AAX4IPF4_9PEZI|nr:Putative SKP1/BTB/POZ domain superfamily protein [Colletotrichum destructivum]